MELPDYIFQKILLYNSSKVADIIKDHFKLCRESFTESVKYRLNFYDKYKTPGGIVEILESTNWNGSNRCNRKQLLFYELMILQEIIEDLMNNYKWNQSYTWGYYFYPGIYVYRSPINKIHDIKYIIYPKSETLSSDILIKHCTEREKDTKAIWKI